MDIRTKKALKAMQSLILPGDIVYTVIRTEKKSYLYHFWDMILDFIPSLSSALIKQKVFYLLASENEGKLIEIRDTSIVQVIQVPSWTNEKKHNFKKVQIDHYLYKKVGKI